MACSSLMTRPIRLGGSLLGDEAVGWVARWGRGRGLTCEGCTPCFEAGKGVLFGNGNEEGLENEEAVTLG